MINIEEKLPKKMPGVSSLFITFPYNQTFVEIVKQTGHGSWDAKEKVWECGTIYLSKLLDAFAEYDEVSLKLLDFKEEQATNFLLSSYKTTPFNYQLDGIQWGLNHNTGLLLDAPGLGKTLMTIYLAQEIQKRDNIKHCFIICGINTLKSNWKKEIQKHSDLSCKILGERTTKKGKEIVGSVKDRIEDLNSPIDEFFVITNVETIRNDEIVKGINSGPNKFDMIVFDECHVAKSPTSEQGKRLLKLTKATYRYGLTGTLLLNNPLDAYVPLKWVGADHSTYTNFKYFYCTFTGPFNNILLGYKNIPVLKDQLDKYSLRRTKDILNLPPKTIIDEFVDMTPDQESFYQNIVNGVVEQVDKVELNATNLLALTSRLRQATACPRILTTELISSSKIDRACDLASQILDGTDEKLVIFSVFKETLNELNEKLAKYNPLLCTGDVKDEIISENIDAFQNNESNRIILCTTAKMGTGITLTRASYEIFIDCGWTRAINLQCEDRCHRIGSDKPVLIYYLWTNNTIDTHVKEIVEDKGLISDYVVDNKCPPALTSRLKDIILDLKET